MSKLRNWRILAYGLSGTIVFIYCLYVIKMGTLQAALPASLSGLLVWLWLGINGRLSWVTKALLGIASLLAVILVIQLGTILASILAILGLFVGAFCVPWITDRLVKWRRG